MPPLPGTRRYRRTADCIHRIQIDIAVRYREADAFERLRYSSNANLRHRFRKSLFDEPPQRRANVRARSVRHAILPEQEELRRQRLVHAFVEVGGDRRPPRKTDEQRAALQTQLTDIERRVARWQDAFETGAESADVVLPRLRELTAQRDELAATLAKVVPLHRPPPHLHTEATLERFQGMRRQVFLIGQSSMTRNYLRFLVERIEAGPTKAEGTAMNVVDNTGAAVALMASVGPQLSAPVNPQGPALSCVNDWLQLQDSNLGPGG
jgi:hypothetical protein